MVQQVDKNDPRVISYHALRKAIGIIGFFLPLVLILGKGLVQILQGEPPSLQPSVSGYYYTVTGGVLVGSLCAIGVFLVSYVGYDDPDWLISSERVPGWLRGFARVTDNRASNVAGLSAVGVALFPTPNGLDPTTLEEFLGDDILGLLHVGSAAVFFVALAYISLRLFTKRGPATNDPLAERRKRRDNLIYTVCGWAILACIALIVVVWLLPNDSPIREAYPVLWLEWGAIVAFSISWFTKGLVYTAADRPEPEGTA